MTSVLLVTFPADAVMFAVPCPTAVIVPPFTVATWVLLETHVAVLVIGTEPLHVTAVAVTDVVFRPDVPRLRVLLV
jgi:hypothetical protein